MLATDGHPVNYGFSCKGNDSGVNAIRDLVEAGASSIKVHEDWGSTPEVIDRSLQVADEYDVQVNIHTDTMNEGGYVENTVDAFKGRTIHTYHTEGAGGGHAPDVIVVCEHPNVLPSSTNPTRPYGVNTLDEHMDVSRVHVCADNRCSWCATTSTARSPRTLRLPTRVSVPRRSRPRTCCRTWVRSP